MRKTLVATVLFACLAAFAGSLYAESVFPVRLDDPRAVYLTKEQFNVQADGVADDSDALQAAVDRVGRTGILFIPEGRYRLGKTVYVWEGIRLIGYGKTRPVFVLGENTPGFQEGASTWDGTGKYMVHFAGNRSRGAEGVVDASEVSFYGGMKNIDFEMKDGNPAAIAVRFHVAQHSTLQHMDFHVGTCRAAVEDIGNQSSDIHVYGGQYGIITKRTSPVWQYLLMDSTFEGQTKAAIQTMDAGFTLVRVSFAHMPTALQITPGQVDQLYGRDLHMTDITEAALKSGNVQNTHSTITLTNVACSDVPTFYQGDDEYQGDRAIKAPSKHYMVDRLALGLEIGDDGLERGIFLRHEERALAEAAPPVPTDIPALPPENEWVNVRTVGVAGDGRTDDTAALRTAMKEHKALYFPSGTYRISEPIELGPESVLVGLNPGTTSISMGGTGAGNPPGALIAPKDGKCIVVSMGVSPGAGCRAAVAWMAGPESMLDDVTFGGGGGGGFGRGGRGGASVPNYDLLITDGGGGIFRGDWPHGTSSRGGGLRIENTSTKGKIYQMSVEHHNQVECQFVNVENWEIYALQTEEENPAGHQAIAMEIENCRNLLLANTYMYRVSRTTLPMTYGIKVRNSDNIRFENMKVFSQTRLAFDTAVVDEDSGVTVRPQFFTSFVVKKGMKAPEPAPLPAVFAKDAKIEKLADGFSNASGLTTDAAGTLYFTDAAEGRVYRFNAAEKKAEVLAATQNNPQVAAFVEPSTLMIVMQGPPPRGYSQQGVFSIDVTEEGTPMRPVTVTMEKAPDTILLLPVGLHNMKSILDDLMDRRDYVYRGGSNTAVVRVVEGAARGYFYAPGTKTAVFAGGTWRPILQASTMAAFAPGDEHYVTSEDDGLTFRSKLGADEKLTSTLFTSRGGTSVINDLAGNVYIASDQVYIYSPEGKQIGVLVTPERPGSLAFGGPDNKTLFIGARSSLYSVQMAAAGR